MEKEMIYSEGVCVVCSVPGSKYGVCFSKFFIAYQLDQDIPEPIKQMMLSFELGKLGYIKRDEKPPIEKYVHGL